MIDIVCLCISGLIFLTMCFSNLMFIIWTGRMFIKNCRKKQKRKINKVIIILFSTLLWIFIVGIYIFIHHFWLGYYYTFEAVFLIYACIGLIKVLFVQDNLELALRKALCFVFVGIW